MGNPQIGYLQDLQTESMRRTGSLSNSHLLPVSRDDKKQGIEAWVANHYMSDRKSFNTMNGPTMPSIPGSFIPAVIAYYLGLGATSDKNKSRTRGTKRYCKCDTERSEPGNLTGRLS